MKEISYVSTTEQDGVGRVTIVFTASGQNQTESIISIIYSAYKKLLMHV